MSYDFFLWRINRRVAPGEINETTVESWPDPDELRTTLARLYPTLRWNADAGTAIDTTGESPIRDLRLPESTSDRCPLVIRTSLRGRDTGGIRNIGRQLDCLVYDTQTNEILWQPGDD